MELNKKKDYKSSIKRGDIYYAKLLGFGNQQTGIRPVLIYSNNTNNVFSPTVNVMPITAELKELCVHVNIKGCGLKSESMILVEQITTINKTQIKNKIGRLTSEYMDLVDIAADIQFGRKSNKFIEINAEEVFG